MTEIPLSTNCGVFHPLLLCYNSYYYTMRKAHPIKFIAPLFLLAAVVVLSYVHVDSKRIAHADAPVDEPDTGGDGDVCGNAGAGDAGAPDAGEPDEGGGDSGGGGY